jgi:thiosulfate dehydrogenase
MKSRSTKPIIPALTLLTVGCFVLLGCEGPAGKDGALGPKGSTGAAGTDGTDGNDGAPCTIVDNTDGTYTVTCPGSDPVVVPPPTSPEYELADATRGGKLYDRFWAVTATPAYSEPTTTHPLYPAGGPATGSATWRCKECHGWDYIGQDGRYSSGSHYTGIAGLYPPRQTAEAAFDIIKTDHGYGAAGLSDADIWDLVRFYREAQIDIAELMAPDGSFVGDPVNGQAIYRTGINGNIPCTQCHGVDGLRPPPGFPMFREWVGLLANDNPQEFQHKVRFGHPGTMMPAAFSAKASLRQIADVSAYAQTLPSGAEYVTADPVRGARLYDRFWAVNGVTAVEPTTDHPLYPADGPRAGSTTWRCKECHGWDYVGSEGRYGAGSHYTGIAGLYPAKRSLFDTFDIIKNDHGYGDAGLTDTDIWDLVKFYEVGMIDTRFIINRDGSFNGDVAAGQTLFTAGINMNLGCAVCHGADGLTPPRGFPMFIEWPGLIANENPEEFQHKVRFGQPGTNMPAAFAVGATLEQIANISTFAQTLPCAATGETWPNAACN